MSTKIINVEDIMPEPPVIVVLEGVEHAMKPQTAADLIANMRDMEELVKLNSDPKTIKLDGELQIMLNVIGRGFPSLSREKLEGLHMELVDRLFTLVRNGGQEPEAGAEGDEGNVTSES